MPKLIQTAFAFALFAFLPNAISIAHGATIKCLQMREAPKNDSVEGRNWLHAYQEVFASTAQIKAACAVVGILGPIESGDYDKLLNIVRQSNGWLTTVALASPGGNLSDALRIGRLIRQLMIATHAPNVVAGRTMMPGVGLYSEDPCPTPSCICASACFVIWAGGIVRYGSVLGIHRPSFDKRYFSSLDLADAAAKYREALNELETYLSEVGVPESYRRQLLEVPSWEISIPSEQIKIDLETPNRALRVVPAHADEWLTAKCGVITTEEINALDAYDDQRRAQWFGQQNREKRSDGDPKAVGKYPMPWDWSCLDTSMIPDPAYRVLAQTSCDKNACRRTELAKLRFNAYLKVFGNPFAK